MLALILALVVVYARWAPSSWLGRALNQSVAAVLMRLRAVRPLTLLCFVLVVAAFGSLIAYGKFDGLVMAALAAPETFALFLAIDVGTAVEVLVVAWLAARRGGLANILRWVRAVAGAVLRRPGRRRVRTRPPRREGEAANDDEPAGGAAFPLAA